MSYCIKLFKTYPIENKMKLSLCHLVEIFWIKLFRSDWTRLLPSALCTGCLIQSLTGNLLKRNLYQTSNYITVKSPLVNKCYKWGGGKSANVENLRFEKNVTYLVFDVYQSQKWNIHLCLLIKKDYLHNFLFNSMAVKLNVLTSELNNQANHPLL